MEGRAPFTSINGHVKIDSQIMRPISYHINQNMEYEYGWNDPPTYSYSQASSDKQTRLNKRPPSSIASAPPAVTDSSTPPTGTTDLLPAPPTGTRDLSSTPPIDLASAPPIDLSSAPPTGTRDLSSTDLTSAPPTGTRDLVSAPPTENSTSATPEERALHVYDDADFASVIEKLQLFSSELQEKFQKRVHEDIKRRLDLLHRLMEAGKLSTAVKLKTGQLVAALDQGDYDTADRIQVSLMVDHVSEVSQWLVAVKKLISTLKSSPRAARPGPTS